MKQTPLTIIHLQICIVTIVSSIILSCGDHDPVERNYRNERKLKEKTTVTTQETISHPDLLAELLLKQTELLRDSVSMASINRLLALSYDSNSQTIYVAGIAPGGQEQSDYEIYLITQRQIARSSAFDWALYIKKLITQKQMVAYTKIRGKIMYSKVLLEESINDTLYQLYAFPVSSIVLQ